MNTPYETLSLLHPNRHVRMISCLGIALGLGLAACGDDEDPMTPDPSVNPEEVITTMTVTLTPQGGGTPVVAVFRDVDGDGGMPATVTQPQPLTAGTTYDVAVELLDETKNPPEDITEEIEEEAEEHLFIYVVTGGVATVTITDRESEYPNGNMVGDDLPVGLEAELTATSAGTGSLQVVLLHLPPENGTPVKTPAVGLGDGFEEDINQTFQLTVQ